MNDESLASELGPVDTRVVEHQVQWLGGIDHKQLLEKGEKAHRSDSLGGCAATLLA